MVVEKFLIVICILFGFMLRKFINLEMKFFWVWKFVDFLFLEEFNRNRILVGVVVYVVKVREFMKLCCNVEFIYKLVINIYSIE